jgi:hypothetical protein
VCSPTRPLPCFWRVAPFFIINHRILGIFAVTESRGSAGGCRDCSSLRWTLLL